MFIEFILICVVVVVVLLWYSGLFTPIHVSVVSSPTSIDVPFTIAYKLYTGPYSGACHAFKELTSLIGRDQPTIGIYYDDPNRVPRAQCRYIVAAIVNDGHETYLTDNYTKHLSNWGYTTITLPPLGRSIVCSFPCTTPLSLMIGAMRVYPKIHKRIQDPQIIERMRMAFEFYWRDSKVLYCFPLENTDAYMVPELK